jgi:hypothetical protein
MNKFIITSHSFVDLITNSSSELFICNTDQSVQAVKGVLIELCKIHNQKMKLANSQYYVDLDKVFWEKDHLDYKDPEYNDKYNHIFGSIEVCEYTFDYCREREDYIKLTQGYDNSCDEYSSAEQKMCIWETNNKISQEHTEEEYREHLKKKDEYAQTIYADYYQLCREAFHKLLVVYCEKNNINYDDVSANLNESGCFGCIRFYIKDKANKEVYKFLNSLNESISWNYTTEKGQILIESATDNSIPYWMFEDIENIFQAQRRHLG